MGSKCFKYPTHLVPALSELSLEMTQALACLDPTYTVLISTLPHITFNSQLLLLIPWRMNGMWSIRFLRKEEHVNFILRSLSNRFRGLSQTKIFDNPQILWNTRKLSIYMANKSPSKNHELSRSCELFQNRKLFRNHEPFWISPFLVTYSTFFYKSQSHECTSCHKFQRQAKSQQPLKE